MRLEHLDYIILVKEAYNKKRVNNELSPLLAKSTPASIRQECLNVYEERYDKKDEPVLRAFFGPAEPGKKFLQLIEGFPVDKFKPLDNYLKGSTEKTDDKNLNLLAWLINFQHRPFAFGMEVTLNEDELSTIKKSGSIQLKIVSEETNLQEGKKVKDVKYYLKKDEVNKPRRRVIVIFLIVVTCLGGLYFIWQQKRSGQLVLENVITGCMYWADDHYEPIPCKEYRKGILKLPIDSERMNSFKKILREDTITEKSIGKVYYIKIDGRIEYYTTGGNHPVDVTRTLKPLSLHMFETYLGKQKTVNKLP